MCLSIHQQFERNQGKKERNERTTEAKKKPEWANRSQPISGTALRAIHSDRLSVKMAHDWGHTAVECDGKRREKDGLPGWLGATGPKDDDGGGGGCWSGSRSSHDEPAESVNSSSSSSPGRLLWWWWCCCCSSVCHCCSAYNEAELLSTAPPAGLWWWWLWWWWRRPIKSAMFGPHKTSREDTSSTLVVGDKHWLTHTHYWLLFFRFSCFCYCLYCVDSSFLLLFFYRCGRPFTHQKTWKH